MNKIIITGGHHSSALPVISELKKRYPNIEIFWIGHKYSLKKDKNPTLEYLEITSLKIPFYDLKTGKFYKNYSIINIFKIILGLFNSYILIKKIKPSLVLSFGGYIAAPVVFAAYVAGIKSITHEQTVVAGYANKFIGLFAKKILISWKKSEKFFPASKTVYTGLPLRNEIFEINSQNYFFDNKLPIIYITAGKSGSHKVNDAVYKILDNLLDIANVIHQCGDYSRYNDYQRLLEKYNKIKASHKGKYFLKKFIFADEIGEVFSKADLVVSRSGAHTCFELARLGKPCLLIPIPWVSHNEQFLNAQELVEAGIAEIFEEDNLNTSDFLNTIISMLLNNNKYKINKNFDQKHNAAILIVDEMERLILDNEKK